MTATALPDALREPDVPGRMPLLEVRDASVEFPVGTGLHRDVLHAVDRASLVLYEGEVLSIIGESGSGKTTLARLLARMYKPTSGEVLLRGEPVSTANRRSKLAYHGQVQLMFQDPFASLNPTHTIGYNLQRALRLHRKDPTGRAGRRAESEELMRMVNLPPAVLDKRPRELSGGQRQRAVIARALAVRPSVLLADEPISMLDVSIRLGVLNLLRKLADDGLAILYITHDIASARYLADRAAVMYAGQIVETGATDDVIASPKHPYTQLLLAATPQPGRPRSGADDADDADPPNLIAPPVGCRFAARCPFATDKCRTLPPPMADTGHGHLSRCWLSTEEGTA
jgi:peptide/nickel transport system ATP-binding protein